MKAHFGVDLMHEVSEGDLPNISQSILAVDVQKDKPPVFTLWICDLQYQPVKELMSSDKLDAIFLMLDQAGIKFRILLNAEKAIELKWLFGKYSKLPAEALNDYTLINK
jgi:hypothetical protein